jgi:mannitol-1-phosphate/altronate dehydrogenase
MVCCKAAMILRGVFAAQDWLSSVVQNDASGMTVLITGSMIDFLAVQAGHRPTIETITADETRIVPLTVTEGGYFVDASTESFDPGQYSEPNKTAHGIWGYCCRACRATGRFRHSCHGNVLR